MELKKEKVMFRLALLIAFAAPISLFQPLSAPAQSDTHEGDSGIHLNGVGVQCEIVLKTQKPRSLVTISGKIVHVDDGFIVLSSATRTTHVERIVPILGRLPFVGRLFRYYVAVGRAEIEGESKIPRPEIATITSVNKSDARPKAISSLGNAAGQSICELGSHNEFSRRHAYRPRQYSFVSTLGR